ncbi:MAG: hypothetical protein WC194_11720, partial [Mesotoga sp.]|uniref:hypothetical protein n=1 Tax=Mesotoga sp. TaxID=2053577 RepID=UPI003561FC31
MQIGLQGAGERQARIKDEQASQMRLSEQSQQELQKRGITRAYGQGTYELNKQYEAEPSAVDNYRERAEEAYQSDVNYTANATFKEFLRDKDTQDYLQSPEIQAIIQRANEAQDPAEKEQLASEVYNQLHSRYWDSDYYKKVEEFTNRERENIDRRILKDQLSSFKDDLTKSVESAPESDLSEKSGRNIRTAKHFIDESNKLIKNAETGAGIGKGVGDAVFDVDTWTLGITDLVRQNRVGNVADKYERGEKLTKDEEALMDALALHMAASAYYQSGISRQYKWGQIAGESLPFMIEFILNPIAGVGKGIAKSIAKRAITKFGATGAAKTAIKAGSRAIGDVIGATAMTATTGAPRTIADAKRRKLGDATFAIGEDGDFVYAGHEGGVDPFTAASKAFVAQTLEYQSEMLGASGLGKLIGKAVPKGMTKAFKASEFGKMGAGMRNSKMYREARALMERGQWSGTFGEYGEEVYNQAMNALIVGDNKLSDLTDVHEQIDIFMGLALTGGVMGTVSSAAYLRDRNRVNARIKNADRQAAAAIEGWDETKEQIGNMSVSERTRAAADAMLDDSVPVGARKAYADYIINLSQRDSMLGAMQEKQVRDIEIGKETGTRLYSSLRDKRSVALYSLNNEKQQLEAELGDLTTLSYEEVINSPESTPELIQARERYDIVNAEYEGVMENLKREVDDFIAPQVQAIQDVAKDGVITELNVGTEDAPDIVYLVKGD